MKKKIISTILLIAMVVSHIPVWGGSDSNGNVSDSGNRRDDSDNPDNPDNPENSKKPSEPQVPFEVKFSHEAGFYSEEFLLELSVPEEYGEDSQIWYTTGEDVTGIVLPAEASRLSRHDGGVTPVPSAPSTLYVEPIVVSIPPDVNVFTVSAIFVGGGKVSQPVTRSYVRGTDVENRFHSDMVVFSLYSDVFGLYDYNDGIFVPGIDRDEWREEYIRINGRAPDPWKWDTELPPTSPANFNRRGRGSERAVHVEMFDSSGERFIAQRAGMRVKGGWSRGTFVYEQKSLEFYARNSYGDRDNFLFPIFGEQYAEDGNLMHRYRRFRLRNGGSDREQSYLRDELSHTLFKQAGFDDVQGHRPAVVFLNGEYYGLSFVKTPRTEDHWRRRYGGEESGFVIIGSNERGSVGCETPGCGRVIPGLGETGGRTPASNVIRCGSSNQCGRVDCEIYQSGLDDGCVENGRCRGTSDWREIRRLVLGSGGEENPDGLDDDKAFAEFCERVDIDNLIHYYALEMYIANVDWPSNNVEMWRYFPDSSESDLHPKLADGKWRFVAQDLELAYGLWSEDTLGPASGTKPTDNTIRALMNRTGVNGGGGHFGATEDTFIIPALMRRSDMREKLANAFIDMMEGAFEPENAIAVLEELRGQIRSEHRRMVNDSTRRISEIDRDNNHGTWPNWDAVERGDRQLKSFLERRPAEKLKHIESELGLSALDRFALTLKNGEGGEAVMNTRPVGENRSATGNYYKNTEIVVTAKPYRGYTLSHWIVDGERTAAGVSEALTLNVSSDTEVEVVYKICTDYAETANLYISSVKDGVGANDWLELTNDSGRTLSTAGLFLSDSNDLQKFALPTISVAAGETIRIASAGNESDYEFAAVANFNLAFGERLRLSDSSGNALQLVEVSFMRESEIQLLSRDSKFRIVDEITREPTPKSPTREGDSGGNNSGNNNGNNSGNNNGNNQENLPETVDAVTTGGVTAVYTPADNSVAIFGIPESGDWSVSVKVEKWPPSGGPWGIPDGVDVSYSNGILTFSGSGRHGWGDTWNANWGYW